MQVDTGRQAAAECRSRRPAEAVDRVDGRGGGRRDLIGAADVAGAAEPVVGALVDTLVDLVTVPERQGLEAVDILRLRGGCGGVLHDVPAPAPRNERQAVADTGSCTGAGGVGSTLSFLVPFGTAEAWQLPGSSCRRICVPGLEYDWLLPPGDGLGRAALTDPGQLSEALGEAARTLAVCDGC